VEYCSYSLPVSAIVGPETEPVDPLLREGRKEKEIVLDILVTDDVFLFFIDSTRNKGGKKASYLKILL